MTAFDDDLLPTDPEPGRSGLKIGALIACGGCLVIALACAAFFVLIGLAVEEGFVADSKVNEGHELREKDRDWMRENFHLDDDEEILWAYSRELTFQLETNLVTDRRVAFDESTGFGVRYEMAPFELIESMDVDWGVSFADTRVTFHRRDDLGPFDLWLSPEDGRDREVVAWLRERLE